MVLFGQSAHQRIEPKSRMLRQCPAVRLVPQVHAKTQGADLLDRGLGCLAQTADRHHCIVKRFFQGVIDGIERRCLVQPQIGIHRQHSCGLGGRGQVIVKKECFADAPGRKQAQGPARLGAKQGEIALRQLGTANLQFFKCLHHGIVVYCCKSNNCCYWSNEQQEAMWHQSTTTATFSTGRLLLLQRLMMSVPCPASVWQDRNKKTGR